MFTMSTARYMTEGNVVVAVNRRYIMSYGHKGVGGEVPLSQCDKCGSEVPPDAINWDMRYTFKDTITSMFVGGGLVLIGYVVFNWIW